MQQCQLEVMAAAPVGAAPEGPPGPSAQAANCPPEPDVPRGDGVQAPPQMSHEDALWWAYRRTGKIELRNRLVMFYRPWAESRTRFFAWVRSLDWCEVWGAAALGLIEAVKRFDPAGGVPFRAYASRRIRGALLDASRECYDHDFIVCSLDGGAGKDGSSASDDEPSEGRCGPADRRGQAPPEEAFRRSVKSRLLAAMPGANSREIARRRFWLRQSVDEIAHYMDIEKSRVEEILRDVVLPKVRRLCFELGIRPRRGSSS